MSRTSIVLAWSVFAMLVRPPGAGAATITGTVVGDGARPIAGALVQVVRKASEEPCTTKTGADGTFTLACPLTGPRTVRAVFGELRPGEVTDVELAADRDVHLNFVLNPPGPATPEPPMPQPPASPPSAAAGGFWTRPIPNPVVTTLGSRPITLRMLSILVAVVTFPLGALTMLALGRRFGVRTRELSAGEAGDMLLNPHVPGVGERTTPVATAGARGASATVSFGRDDIASALAERRYGLVFAALVVAPALFAAFAAGLALAMGIGHEAYLFYAMLLVPAVFLLTPLVIGLQAVRTAPRA